MKHFNVHIYGDVQGVGFRALAFKKAKELDIGGFVRNESDGSVYIEAEGEERLLNKFLAWCSDGPPTSKVEDVQKEEAELIGFQDFEIN